jgi:DNA-binding transcriptional LysR family regulator
MDFDRLRTLRELSKRGTMTAVAEALRVSPSAVSQQIAQLEDELGLPLVERRGRGVRLTRGGERLVVQAERVFAIIEEARTDLAEMRAEVAGDLRVAAFPSVAVSLLPAVMRDLAARYPRLTVTLDVMEPDLALAALRAWQVDAALIDSFAARSGGESAHIDTTAVYDDQLYAVLPAGHRLCQRPALSLSDMASERWALDTASSAYFSAIMDECRRQGFEPTVNGYCNGFEVVTAMIEAGVSISVMPGLLVTSFPGNFRFRRIEPPIGRAIAVAVRRGEGRKPALAAFVETLVAAGAARAQAPDGGALQTGPELCYREE